jgi:hypothetical protein
VRREEEKLLQTTLGRLKSFESESIERLARVEENLRLLRQELVGNGRAGRITLVEQHVDHLRAAHQRQRGIAAAISLIISLAAALLIRWLES